MQFHEISCIFCLIKIQQKDRKIPLCVHKFSENKDTAWKIKEKHAARNEFGNFNSKWRHCLNVV